MRDDCLYGGGLTLASLCTQEPVLLLARAHFCLLLHLAFLLQAIFTVGRLLTTTDMHTCAIIVIGARGCLHALCWWLFSVLVVRLRKADMAVEQSTSATDEDGDHSDVTHVHNRQFSAGVTASQHSSSSSGASQSNARDAVHATNDYDADSSQNSFSAAITRVEDGHSADEHEPPVTDFTAATSQSKSYVALLAIYIFLGICACFSVALRSLDGYTAGRPGHMSEAYAFAFHILFIVGGYGVRGTREGSVTFIDMNIWGSLAVALVSLCAAFFVCVPNSAGTMVGDFHYFWIVVALLCISGLCNVAAGVLHQKHILLRGYRAIGSHF